MKKFLKVIGVLFAVGIIGIVLIILLMPWMDRWGATRDEISGSLTGDELVPSPGDVLVQLRELWAITEPVPPNGHGPGHRRRGNCPRSHDSAQRGLSGK